MSLENLNITIDGNNNNANFLFNSNNSKMIEASITEIENNLIKKKMHLWSRCFTRKM